MFFDALGAVACASEPSTATGQQGFSAEVAAMGQQGLAGEVTAKGQPGFSRQGAIGEQTRRRPRPKCMEWASTYQAQLGLTREEFQQHWSELCDVSSCSGAGALHHILDELFSKKGHRTLFTNDICPIARQWAKQNYGPEQILDSCNSAMGQGGGSEQISGASAPCQPYSVS
jgi:hypothetical protein